MRTAIQATLCAALLLSASCSLTLDPNDVEAPKRGGGGGGPLEPGTFVKTFAPPSTVPTYDPFTGTYDIRHQMLYAAGDVGGAGRISAIRFQRSAAMAAAVTCPSIAFRFGHTSLAALGRDLTSNVNMSSITTALPYGSLTIPAGAAGDWFEVRLATPYDYDGVSNLVIEIETMARCTADVALASAGRTSARAMMMAPDTDPNTSQLGGLGPTSVTIDDFQLSMQLVFSGGEDYLAYAGTTTNWNDYLLRPSVSGIRVMNLHRASEIAGSGPVTGVAFQLAATSPAGTYMATVKMGHFAGTPGVGVLSSTFAQNYAGAPVTIADNVTFTVPAGRPAGDWIWIPVTEGAFSYDGTDDLLVEVITSTATGGSQPFRYQPRTTGIQAVADGVSTPTADALGIVALHLGLRFAGGHVSLTLPAGAQGSGVLSDGSNGGQVQSLYDAHRVGTAGTIDRIGVRLAIPDSLPTTVPNVKIYMGETAKQSLNPADTYGSNMDGQVPVYVGTITVPAGLKYGDWLDIPLQSTFAYDARKNLVVLFTEDAAAANFVRMSFDASTASRSVSRFDNTVSPTGTPTGSFNGFVDLRLGFQP
jgi:hypothetical protein